MTVFGPHKQNGYPLFSLLVGAAAVDVATSRRMEENDEEDAEATDERE